MEPKLFISSVILIVQIAHASSITDEEYLSMPIIFHVDDYDRCQMRQDDNLYCMVTFQLYPEKPENPSKVWKIVENVSRNTLNYRHDILRHGICISDTCPNATKNPDVKEGLSHCYNQKYKHMEIKAEVTKMRCEGRESPYQIANFDYFYAIFIISYITFVIFASLYEGIARYKTGKEYERITGTTFGKLVSAFSIPRNWFRLKTVNLDNPEIRNLRFIQGIRFYNLVLVILVHTLLTKLSMPVSNPSYTENITQHFIYIYLGNGGFALLTNFLITMWLFTNHFFMEFDGKREVKISDFFNALFIRYIRLTPLLAVVIGFNATWMVHLGRGPFWDYFIGEEYRKCRNNWWTNLLYVNNYVNKESMCMVQTWYLGVDMQFFIAGFFILWFMLKHQKRIPLVIGALTVAHLTIMFVIIYWHNWDFNYKFNPEKFYHLVCFQDQEWHMVLTSAYSNLPGLTGGLTFGYIYYKYKNSKLFTSKFQIFIWWCACWGFALGSVTISGIHLHSPSYQPNLVFDSVYGSLSRIAFVFGIGITMIGLSQGVGSAMNWVTEWPPTYVMGRLSYSAFLVNSIIPRLRGGTRKNLGYLSYGIVTGEFCEDVALTYIGALFLTLLFEMPVSELLKFLVTKTKKQKIK